MSAGGSLTAFPARSVSRLNGAPPARHGTDQLPRFPKNLVDTSRKSALLLARARIDGLRDQSGGSFQTNSLGKFGPQNKLTPISPSTPFPWAVDGQTPCGRWGGKLFTMRRIVNSPRNSDCGSAKLSDLDWSNWWIDLSFGQFYLHVRRAHPRLDGPGDESWHRVHCRATNDPRIRLMGGRLYWII